MLKEIYINNSLLKYRDTPWDERVFGIETKEILDIQYKDEEDISKLLLAFENKFEKTGLIYFRKNSNDKILKRYLINSNYYIAETSLKLNLSKVNKHNFSIKFKNNLSISESILNAEDICQIKEISRTSFEYSRFHEDPFINKNLANLRYENWIDDLIKQNKKVLIYKNNENEILSFMFYSCSNNKVDLILGGSRQKYGLLTPSFFASVLTYLKSMEVTKIDVMISVSNIVIFNIYINLNFCIKESFFDYHKIIKK